MGLFSKKPKLSQNEVAFKMANNVFKNVVTTDETYEKVIQGKGPAENLIFSVGILAATPKRLLYYAQDRDKTTTETILYDKIISVSQISGLEKKMGNFIGVSVELANGQTRTVRCVVNDENKRMVNELIICIESMR